MTWFKTSGRTKIVIKVGEISGKCDILTIGGTQISLIVNTTKRILEMNLKQTEVGARW